MIIQTGSMVKIQGPFLKKYECLDGVPLKVLGMNDYCAQLEIPSHLRKEIGGFCLYSQLKHLQFCEPANNEDWFFELK